MADYPCDWHLARYQGPSSRCYLNIYREDQSVKLKASVCSDCLADIVTEWLQRALHETPGGGWDPPAEQLELDMLWNDAGGRSAPLNGARRR